MISLQKIISGQPSRLLSGRKRGSCLWRFKHVLRGFRKSAFNVRCREFFSVIGTHTKRELISMVRLLLWVVDPYAILQQPLTGQSRGKAVHGTKHEYSVS
jgi:hypothetical protein